MDSIPVQLDARSYSIHIGRRALPHVGSLLNELTQASHVVAITDENVETPHAHTVCESIAATGVEVDLIVVEPGEASKSIEVSAQLWQRLLDLQADRRSVVVAVGGGVVGDLAGWIAASYARGLQFFQVPTTLLAQVDSSVGGKVGVNLPAAKNIVGAFWQPVGVLIDIDVLETLPPREYRAGLAEVVKYGASLDASFFELLEARADDLNQIDAELLRQVIAQCCRLKAGIVQQDEREQTGRRAVLNYGHTFAHALESVAGYGRLLHGEAVSIGMTCAARLAVRLGRIDQELADRQQQLLDGLQLPTALPKLDRDALLAAMSHDKKVEHGRLRFVLPTRLGHVELVDDVPMEDVAAVLS